MKKTLLYQNLYWSNKMNFDKIKNNLFLISEEIKKSKYLKSYHFKLSSYYRKEYDSKSIEEDKNLCYKEAGKAAMLQSQLNEMKIQARSYNILLAFSKGRRFDSVEKYYYGEGIQKQCALLLQSKELYSKYTEAKAKQQLALNNAKIAMGYFKYKNKITKRFKYFGNDKEATEWKEFDEWVSKTGNLV